MFRVLVVVLGSKISAIQHLIQHLITNVSIIWKLANTPEHCPTCFDIAEYCAMSWVCYTISCVCCAMSQVFCSMPWVCYAKSSLQTTKCTWSIGSIGWIGGADRTFACKSQECLWQDWYILSMVSLFKYALCVVQAN